MEGFRDGFLEGLGVLSIRTIISSVVDGCMVVVVVVGFRDGLFDGFVDGIITGSSRGACVDGGLAHSGRGVVDTVGSGTT